jgi:hypothetical protein
LSSRRSESHGWSCWSFATLPIAEEERQPAREGGGG